MKKYVIWEDDGYNRWQPTVEADTIEELNELANKEYFFKPISDLIATVRIDIGMKVEAKANE